MVLNFIKYRKSNYWHDLFFSLLKCGEILYFRLSYQSYTPGLCSIWSWCIIFYVYIAEFHLLITFRNFYMYVYYWNEVGNVPSFFSFWKKYYKIHIIYFLSLESNCHWNYLRLKFSLWEGFIVSRTIYSLKLNFYITANKLKWNFKEKRFIYKEHKILGTNLTKHMQDHYLKTTQFYWQMLQKLSKWEDKYYHGWEDPIVFKSQFFQNWSIVSGIQSKS